MFNEPGSRLSNGNMLNPGEFNDLAEALERALFTFESTSNHAVVRLYRRGVGSSIDPMTASSHSSIDENSVLMGADSESIFLVYLYVCLCLGV